MPDHGGEIRGRELEARPFPEDGTLLDRFHLGDGSAFDEVVDRYYLPVYRLANRLSLNRADAEDLTQEVFVRAYRSLGTFRRASSLKTWLFQIAINLWRDSCRRARLGAEPPLHSSQELGPLARLERQELQARLQAAIARLPEKERAACILRLLHDLTFKEVGEVMRSPIGTVKANYYRAVVRLRRLLQEPSPPSPHSQVAPERLSDSRAANSARR